MEKSKMVRSKQNFVKEGSIYDIENFRDIDFSGLSKNYFDKLMEQRELFYLFNNRLNLFFCS